MLIIYHSLQMSPLSHHPFISNCKVPIYIRALKRTHEDQLNGDIVPCQVFLPRNLFAGVVAKHLQVFVTVDTNEAKAPGKRKPPKISYIKTDIVQNPTKYQRAKLAKQYGGKMTTISFTKCQKPSSLHHAPQSDFNCHCLHHNQKYL